MTPAQREALTKAEATFRRYGDLHAAKPDQVKAAANYELADRMAAALAEPAPVQEPVLLQCMGCERIGTQEQLSASTDCDCWLHTQPAPVQEPSHDVVAGAIFDFAGFLTSHKVMIEVGSCSNASPMVERIKEWSGNRGLSLENPDVFGWQMRTAQPRKAAKLSDDDLCLAFNEARDRDEGGMACFRAIEQAVWAKLGVTE